MDEQNAALILLSGGMDSTVLLHEIIKKQHKNPVHAIAFDYGQRHKRELDCARYQAQALNTASFKIINMNFLGELLASGTSLVTAGAEVPDLADLDDTELSQPPTYVPNRNMMLLSLAAAYAESINIRDIYYGAQAHDEYGYWDCTQEFLTKINTLLALNRRDAITIHAPFVTLKKHQLVTLGNTLQVDFAQTWSCYKGKEKPCQTCPTCIERANAFQQAQTQDPLAPTP